MTASHSQPPWYWDSNLEIREKQESKLITAYSNITVERACSIALKQNLYVSKRGANPCCPYSLTTIKKNHGLSTDRDEGKHQRQKQEKDNAEVTRLDYFLGTRVLSDMRKLVKPNGSTVHVQSRLLAPSHQPKTGHHVLPWKENRKTCPPPI